MDTTFITIHDLSVDARILYSSDSIVDILGHTPDEVVNRSVWDWFHPQDVPVAKRKHQRGVKLDKAAVLSYAHIKNRNGDYVCCECCFSVVYDVMVCCTSIYRAGISSQKRAVEAPLVRRLFASSPKDPRYHMLSHLSSKFSLGDEEQTHEPRAALFLNRFTRSLTVMYATSGIEQIIGISSEAMKGRSFYYCIQENCLEDAVRCLESAKGNDSIAYLRFFFRDPRQDDPPEATSSESEDDIMTDITGSEDESEGGVDAGHPFDRAHSGNNHSSESSGTNSNEPPSHPRTDSADSTNTSDTHGAIFGDDSAALSSTSSLAASPPQSEARDEPIELEAVVSCTSDGLVVCLRRARPLVPTALPIVEPAYRNGIFAAPWAQEPMFHPALPRALPYPLGAVHPTMAQAGPTPALQDAFMQSIRDVAVFAWALTGINGTIADYAKGVASGESQPPGGFPVWNPIDNEKRNLSAAPSGYVSGNSSSSNDPFGDPGLS
ncbi:hypothetical protein K491DRAFT_700407 [Lophiostoma macrostomum CBS 122681]|uniref:PAS domain-containing protein n=1 Tax=Lophiostoma macrostomum CBS 122681 TaxID=1314788 RepID=A0A6A6TSA7_9PLEO|nr:hypothetical protein K491DRAFT_700407 [Lophiostoma macrostomum CBS 122681]